MLSAAVTKHDDAIVHDNDNNDDHDHDNNIEGDDDNLDDVYHVESLKGKEYGNKKTMIKERTRQQHILLPILGIIPRLIVMKRMMRRKKETVVKFNHPLPFNVLWNKYTALKMMPF